MNDWEDVTQAHLDGLNMLTVSDAKILQRYPRHPPDAPLTGFEEEALVKVGTGLHLGGYLYPLLHAPVLQHWPILHHRAVLSLLHRGRLRLYTRGPVEYVIRPET